MAFSVLFIPLLQDRTARRRLRYFSTHPLMIESHARLFTVSRPQSEPWLNLSSGSKQSRQPIIFLTLFASREGKTNYIGLSECTANTLRRANVVHPIAAYQVEYSPFTLDIEDPKINLLNTCRELGTTLIAYSPLARGLATGQYVRLLSDSV